MGIAEILGMISLVAGAVWTVAEKINNLHRCMDGRLDELNDRQREIELTVQGNSIKIEEMETTNRVWFTKIHKDIYNCSLPPQE